MSPRRINAYVHRHDTCVLGEGPFWYDEQLWWVDIESGLLLSMDNHGNLIQRIAFGQRIGSAVPVTARTFLVALEGEIARLDLASKTWETMVRLDDLPEGGRFNDGKCDPRGRWTVGTMTHGNAKACSLYSLHKDYSLHRLRGAISISNGLAWSADGSTMYYIDTMALGVFAYDYNLESGAISGERVILRFTKKEGWPDGMAIDRTGRLWIGFWDGWAVRCYQPQTGVCEAVIELPCSRPTSCCFGGAALDRLFITTARHGLGENELLQQPLAGSLFVCDPETTGFSTSIFAHDHPEKTKNDRM